MRVGQASKIVEAIALCSTSAKFLRREHDGDVLLAQGLQPSLDLRGEGAVAQIGPSFVEHEQRRPAVEARFERVHEARQHGGERFRARQEFAHLEGLHVVLGEARFVGVEKRPQDPHA